MIMLKRPVMKNRNFEQVQIKCDEQVLIKNVMVEKNVIVERNLT